MVNRNLIRIHDVSEQEMEAALGGTALEEVDWGGQHISVNQIVEGKVLGVEGDRVVVDVGYKSEGLIPLHEWSDDEPPEPGR